MPARKEHEIVVEMVPVQYNPFLLTEEKELRGAQ